MARIHRKLSETVTTYVMEESPDPKPQIIETRVKTPLLKGWEYPIGAEIVTKGLEACARRDEVRLHFYCEKMNRWNDGEPRIVLYAKYSSWRSGVGGLDRAPSWDIWVKAVPREVAFRIRELLIEEGLPQASVWLSANRTATWLDKRHHLDVEFDAENDRLVMVERD